LGGEVLFVAMGDDRPLRVKEIPVERSALHRATDARSVAEAEELRQLLFPVVFRQWPTPAGIPACGRVWLDSDFLKVEEQWVERGAPAGVLARLRELAAAADVLATAHDRGVIHCDIKPGHIRTDEKGQVWVLDWDAAMAWRRPGSSFGFCGTPRYMAPEQASGHLDSLSPRTDVFALGLVGLEILTGRPPRREASDLMEALTIASGPAPLPGESERRRWASVSGVLTTALSRDPRARHADAGTFGRDLRAALEADA
jgi:serine/threonine protein kinase